MNSTLQTDSTNAFGVPMSLASHIVLPLGLWVVVLLQANITVLWSESRMFRKISSTLKLKSAKRLRQEIVEQIGRPCSNDEIFATLYLNICKGRNRFVKRMFPNVLLFSMWVLDVATLSDAFMVLYTSDAFTAFRLMISVGALSVLGAFRLSIYEGAFLTLGWVAYIFSFSFLSLREKGSTFVIAVNVFRSTLMGVASVFLLAKIAFQGKGEDKHLSSILNSISSGKLSKNRRQSKRLQVMRAWIKRLDSEKNVEEIQTSSFSKYWHPKELCYELIVTVLLLCTNGMSWNLTSHEPLFWLVVVLESSDYLLFVLLFINDSQVEPELFLQLLRISDSGPESCNPSILEDSDSRIMPFENELEVV